MKIQAQDKVRFEAVHVVRLATVEIVDVENQMVVLIDESGDRWHVSPKAIKSVVSETAFDGVLDDVDIDIDIDSAKRIRAESRRAAIHDVADALTTIVVADSDGIAFVIDCCLSADADERLNDEQAITAKTLFDLLATMNPEAVKIAQSGDYSNGSDDVKRYCR